MTITVYMPDGTVRPVLVTPYRRWRDRCGFIWLAVTDGNGRHWRVKEKP